jgi:hypothetical protein
MTRPNADILTTRVTDGIALITLGSAKRIYFDEEMGDALTEALDGFAGDANIHVVVVTRRPVVRPDARRLRPAGTDAGTLGRGGLRRGPPGE